jgi:hypothetical protein
LIPQVNPPSGISKNKALADPETRAAYDTLKQKRIGMRKAAGYNVKIDFVYD